MVTVKVSRTSELADLDLCGSQRRGWYRVARVVRLGVVGSLPGTPDSPQAATSPATLNTARRRMDEAESGYIFGPMSWRRG